MQATRKTGLDEGPLVSKSTSGQLPPGIVLCLLGGHKRNKQSTFLGVRGSHRYTSSARDWKLGTWMHQFTLHKGGMMVNEVKETIPNHTGRFMCEAETGRFRELTGTLSFVSSDRGPAVSCIRKSLGDWSRESYFTRVIDYYTNNLRWKKKKREFTVHTRITHKRIRETKIVGYNGLKSWRWHRSSNSDEQRLNRK